MLLNNPFDFCNSDLKSTNFFTVFDECGSTEDGKRCKKKISTATSNRGFGFTEQVKIKVIFLLHALQFVFKYPVERYHLSLAVWMKTRTWTLFLKTLQKIWVQLFR